MLCICVQVHSVAWSCDGKRLASGSFDRTVSVFVLDKDRLVSGTINVQCDSYFVVLLLLRNYSWFGFCYKKRGWEWW